MDLRSPPTVPLQQRHRGGAVLDSTRENGSVEEPISIKICGPFICHHSGRGNNSHAARALWPSMSDAACRNGMDPLWPPCRRCAMMVGVTTSIHRGSVAHADDNSRHRYVKECLPTPCGVDAQGNVRLTQRVSRWVRNLKALCFGGCGCSSASRQLPRRAQSGLTTLSQWGARVIRWSFADIPVPRSLPLCRPQPS